MLTNDSTDWRRRFVGGPLDISTLVYNYVQTITIKSESISNTAVSNINQDETSLLISLLTHNRQCISIPSSATSGYELGSVKSGFN